MPGLGTREFWSEFSYLWLESREHGCWGMSHYTDPAQGQKRVALKPQKPHLLQDCGHTVLLAPHEVRAWRGRSPAPVAPRSPRSLLMLSELQLQLSPFLLSWLNTDSLPPGLSACSLVPSSQNSHPLPPNLGFCWSQTCTHDKNSNVTNHWIKLYFILSVPSPHSPQIRLKDYQ